MIRDARDEDYAAYAELFPELGTGDRTPDEEVWQNVILPSSFVCEADGEVVGFGYVATLPQTGYVRQIIVAPGHRRRGLGRKLMAECHRRFRESGCSSWCLNVKPDNLAAVRLYESLGMARQHLSASVRQPWAIFDSMAAGSDRIAPTEPTEDPDIERGFGVEPGLLATLRANPRVTTWLGRRGDDPVSFAAFDPGFPGCFPFRARDVVAMGSMMRALHPHADPAHDEVQLVLEGQEELLDALTKAGGRVALAFAHYRGPLPDAVH